MVRRRDGRLWKRHQDHLRQRRSGEPQQNVDDDEWTSPTLHPSGISPESPVLPYCKPDAVAESGVRVQVPTLAAISGLMSASSEQRVKVVPLRRPTRFAKPPDKLYL